MLLPALLDSWACPQGKSKSPGWLRSLPFSPFCPSPLSSPFPLPPPGLSVTQGWDLLDSPHLANSSSSCRAPWNVLPPGGPQPWSVWGEATLCCCHIVLRVFPHQTASSDGQTVALFMPAPQHLTHTECQKRRPSR